MPVRSVHEDDVLAAALPQNVRVSTDAAGLYEDVSDDDNFSDCNSEFVDEVARLEREYFDSLHVVDSPKNAVYADCNAPLDGSRPQGTLLSDFEKTHFHALNVTPDRPCSAFFKTDSFMPGSEVFDLLKKEGFLPEHIRCLQRKPSGEIFLTFRNAELRNAFLSKTSLVHRQRGQSRNFVPNNAERSLTFLTVYDAPYELSDTAIIHRLSPFCDVAWYRRGKYKGEHSAVYNGLRHYRVHIHHAIPSFLRFGKFLIRLNHDGQVPTCRKCNRSGHKAAECRNIVCFNCDGLGHTSHVCVRPMYCCICKSGQHLARSCPFSWYRQTERNAAQGEPAADVNVHEGEQGGADHPTAEEFATYDPPIPFRPDDPWPEENPTDDQPMPEDTAGGPPVEVADPPTPVLSDLESVSSGRLASSAPSSSGPSLVDSQGFLRPVLGQPSDSSVSVPVPVPAPESVPVSTPASIDLRVMPSESPVSSVVPLSTASWADIVDHIPVPDLPVSVEVPVDLPATPTSVPPARRSGLKPPLPPRPTGRIARRRPASIANLSLAVAPARKTTQPSRVVAPPSQKTPPVDAAALSTPLPSEDNDQDLMETEESSGKRKDPPC